MIIAAVVRHMSLWFDSFVYILAGDILISLSQVMLLSYVGNISNKWFADNERSTSTTLMMASLPIGNLLNHYLASVLFKDGANFEEGFNLTIYIQSVSLIVFSILAVIFIPSEPATPPSKLALVDEEPIGSVSNTCG